MKTVCMYDTYMGSTQDFLDPGPFIPSNLQPGVKLGQFITSDTYPAAVGDDGAMSNPRSILRRLILNPKQNLTLGLILVVAVIQIYLVEQTKSNIPGRTEFVADFRLHPSRLNSSLDGPIFYNLFVPDGGAGDTKRIVKEQLFQRDLTCPNSTIHYTLIGDKSMETYVSSECSRCHMREHMETGNEDHTLQALWDYCRENSGDTIVTYIHDKGSFHASRTNEKARRMATKAAMECRSMIPSNCNICMAAFHPFPQYLASANMWTARCSYINGLYPPQNYSAKIQEMYDTTLNHSILQYSPAYVCLRPYEAAANFWGIGRYALERWALSHPFVKPCEVLPFGEREVSFTDFPQTWLAKIRRAPYGSAKKAGIETGPYKSTFARLKGRLFEWQYIYNETPPTHSWIWKFYKGYEDGAPVFLEKCRNFMRNVTKTGS